jgi:RluA family pseudouridine synthase
MSSARPLIEVLFEDTDFLFVNKPAGLSVLPEGWNKEAPCLIKLMEAEIGRLWVVHRLDKVTSGVLVLARNAPAHRALNLLFEHRQVTKKYHSILVGIPNWTNIQVSLPLKIDSGHFHRTVIDRADGKYANTVFQVMEFSQEFVFVEVTPETGRTHQIRVHAASLGYPLLADQLYGAPATDLISRPALHAHSIQFIHPISHKQIIVTAPYPLDFQQAIHQIKFGKASLEHPTNLEV